MSNHGSSSHFSRIPLGAASRIPSRRASWLVFLALTGAAAQAQPNGATTLPTVQVLGDGDSAVTEGSGAYTPRATAASTGLPLSLRETPQSVTVITRQRIEDQNMRSLVDVMASTPGISVQNYDSERYTFSSRGFPISNYLYDGMPTSFNTGYSAGESSVDPIIYDRVEIVRGATGLLTGAGNPSASINLVRKHATHREFKADVSLGAGAWDTYRASADLSSPLSASGSVRGRIVSAWQDNRSYLEGYQHRKKVFYGVVDADLTASTAFSVGFNYQDNAPARSSWGGFPLWYSDGGRTDWKRSLNTGADWSSWASATQGAFISLAHHFGNGWRVQATGSRAKHEMDGRLFYLYGLPDRHTGLGMNASPAWYLGERKQNGLDLKVSGPFTLFGRRHEAVLGASVTVQHTGFGYRAPLSPAPMGSFLGWNGRYPEPAWSTATAIAARDTTRQAGGYGVLRLSLAEPLKLIAGGRYSTWKIDSIGWGGANRHAFDKQALTPYAGLLYDLNDRYTAYLSYTGIFNPQEKQDRNGDWLDPLDGKAYEAGVKGEFLEGQLNASAALFQVEQNNLAQQDPGHLVPGTLNQAFRAARGTRSRGVDLEMSGQAAPGWHIAAGWSHWTARDSGGNPVQTNQPRSLLRLFTTYQLPGAWNSLTVGGGVNWQSRIYSQVSGPNGAERVSQASYALVNLMARYRFDSRLSAQLNVDNLFDRKYYSQIGFYQQGAWGAGRGAMLTLRYQY